ncbi:MAG TPA: toll/interleukin-1 receptor domain-containing protein [Solirubrobacterales bacterium]|jgi:hypothetical protein
MAGGVFISYRREDTSGEANHLAADLSAELGRGSVFIDIDTIAPGVDFADHIDQALSSCSVALVLIGDRWLSAEGASGQRRLDDDGDFVRMEVATALERPDVTVVPVLVEGARMPAAAELPPQIAGLAKINALDLSSKRWRYDVEQITKLAARGGWRSVLRGLPGWVRLGVPIAALVAAVLIVVTSGGGSERLVLSPATVPPVVDLCSEQLQHGADGNVGPISCEDGRLNQLAWQHLAANSDPLTFTLGPNATPEQVTKALCSDLDSSTIPIITSIYEIAKLYYGWEFGINPLPSPVAGGQQC